MLYKRSSINAKTIDARLSKWMPCSVDPLNRIDLHAHTIPNYEITWCSRFCIGDVSTSFKRSAGDDGHRKFALVGIPLSLFFPWLHNISSPSRIALTSLLSLLQEFRYCLAHERRHRCQGFRGHFCERFGLLLGEPDDSSSHEP